MSINDEFLKRFIQVFGIQYANSEYGAECYLTCLANLAKGQTVVMGKMNGFPYFKFIEQKEFASSTNKH